MPLINPAVAQQARERLARLPGEVRLVVFTQEMECQFCRENRALAEELAALSDKVRLEIINPLTEPEKAMPYRTDKVPALAVVGKRDFGVRFYGIPAGYEFTSLMAAIELCAAGDSGLKPESRAQLAALTVPLDIQVFVTLTCPVCPLAVGLGVRAAIERAGTTLSVVDAAEFPQLANLHEVMAVPKIVVNRGHSFEGALPEDRFVEELVKGALPTPAAG
ncbi:MAG: thioredoxin family protein [bacterium]